MNRFTLAEGRGFNPAKSGESLWFVLFAPRAARKEISGRGFNGTVETVPFRISWNVRE
ncbi:MAG: hypothetical protein ACRD18_07635 [Terriglobia bacterium]